MCSKNPYPIRMGLSADIGQTVNSSQTRDHLIANKPDVILNIGDLSYADHVRSRRVGWGGDEGLAAEIKKMFKNAYISCCKLVHLQYYPNDPSAVEGGDMSNQK